MNITTENIPSSSPFIMKQGEATNSFVNSGTDKDDEQQEQQQQQHVVNSLSDADTQSSHVFDNNHQHQNYITTVDSRAPIHQTKYENTLDGHDGFKDSDAEFRQLDTSQQHIPPINTSTTAAYNNKHMDQYTDDSSSVYSNQNDYMESKSFLLDQDGESTTRHSQHEQGEQKTIYGGDAGISTPIGHGSNKSSISLSSSDGTASSLDDDDPVDELFEGTTHIDHGVLNRSDSANTGASTPPLDDLDDKLYFDDRTPIGRVTTIQNGLEEHVTTDDEYSAVDLNNMDKSTFQEPSNQVAPYDLPTTNNNKTALRLSTVSVSDLNDISLLEDTPSSDDNHDTATTTVNKTSTTRASISSQSSSILKTAMSNITNAVISKSAKSPIQPFQPPPNERPVKPTPIDTTTTTTSSTTSSTKSSTTTQRFVSGLWSPFKSTPTTTTNTTLKKTPQDQGQSQSPLPPSHGDLPGFQEALLAQMEQLNSDNGNDPKAQQLLNLKRQTIRQSLVLASSNIPNKDDYDWDFWSALICDFDQVHKNKDLSRQVQKGVPPSLRGMVWQLLSKSKQVELGASQQYCALLRVSSPYEKMIQRDLSRTFPGHDYFKEQDGVGQEGLYNVVRAYSVYDTEVGYCQGLAFIVGPLLLNMPDEEAFCVLLSLMSNYGLRGHFTPNMEGLHLRIYQFESLVAEHLPHISRHLQRRGIDSGMYASQWLLTLFAYKFPLDLVFRVYDMIFAEGLDVILKFALALLKRNETHLLQLDFEHLLDFLKNGLFEEYKDDERQLVQDANAWNIPRKQFTQLEKEHKARVVKDEQNAKLVETLQKQQTTLRQQVDKLQHATTTLEKEHQDVKDQLRDSQHQRQHMLDEQDGLNTAVTTLQADMQHLPLTIEATFKDQFDPLCTENALLNQTNARLEDQLSSMETLLISIKMKYAQSENERDELSKRLFEMKKVIAQ